jgi:pimeloyl-ACP methyl ester carboxylesterase
MSDTLDFLFKAPEFAVERSSVTEMVKEMIDVGGHRLSVRIAGTGRPAVVLEAPFSSSKWVWKSVWRDIAKFTTVVVYDRAGLGESEPGPIPRTAFRCAKDLRRLLHRSKIGPPYVLVGHSWGGLIVQVFARRYPALVCGMVLVDSSHVDQFKRLDKFTTAKGHEEAIAFRQGPNPEHVDMWLSEAQARRAGRFPRIPLRALSAPMPPEAMVQFDGHRREARAVINRLNQELAKLSPLGRPVRVTSTGHFIQLDRPDAVIRNIRSVVSAVRNREP